MNDHLEHTAQPDCDRFADWLDAGRPAGLAAFAEAHARSCASCRREREAADELESLLAGPLVPAPPGFTSGVMRAIERPRVAALAPTLAWWVRAAAQPACALALLLAGVVLWRPEAFLAAGNALAAGLAGGLAAAQAGPPAASTGTAPLGDVRVATAVLLMLAPGLAWAGFGLARWSERLVARPR